MRKIIIATGVFFFLLSTAWANITFDDIQGKWQLKYRHNSGYEFRFYGNYRAYCILYCGINALVFKGIYTIENENITININETKNTRNIYRINFENNFVKTSSSFFIFNGQIISDGKKKELLLKPVKTIIDGNDSNGYFEPEIKLKKIR
ncbi:MAG: hypothetical protein JW864_19180 [Spirochaetes bacterium]|nr:hypothetical protein [Spirochaetota bacterium]